MSAIPNKDLRQHRLDEQNPDLSITNYVPCDTWLTWENICRVADWAGVMIFTLPFVVIFWFLFEAWGIPLTLLLLIYLYSQWQDV
jgi:hypothetical protein